MRILLVQTILGRREKALYPLGLAYLKAALGDHDVEVLDPNLSPDPDEAVRATVRRVRPDVIGVSLRNIDTTHVYDKFSYLDCFGDQLELLRREAPDALIVAGGAGFSVFPEALMRRFPVIDCGIRFEGEAAFPALLEHLDDPGSVPGVFVRDASGQVNLGTPRVPADLSQVQPPDRVAIPIQPYLEQPYAVGIQTKRGCVFDCLYCIYPMLEGSHSVRLHDLDRVVDEVERVVAAGVREFYFVDQVFNYPREHALAVCEALIRRGLKPTWRAFFSEAVIDDELVSTCVRAGCRMFEFSPDGICDESLQALGKPYTFDDIRRAYAVIDRYPEARLKISFMMGAPGERTRDLLKLARFLAEESLHRHYRFFSTVEVMRIYPGTPLHRLALERGVVTPDDDLLEPRFFKSPGMDLVRLPLDLSYKAVLAALRITGQRTKIPF
jgi:anaerobic magnesium-protoporphyrin IX monomethyl ester cyclase